MVVSSGNSNIDIKNPLRCMKTTRNIQNYKRIVENIVFSTLK